MNLKMQTDMVKEMKSKYVDFAYHGKETCEVHIFSKLLNAIHGLQLPCQRIGTILYFCVSVIYILFIMFELFLTIINFVICFLKISREFMKCMWYFSIANEYTKYLFIS